MHTQMGVGNGMLWCFGGVFPKDGIQVEGVVLCEMWRRLLSGILVMAGETYGGR